MAGGINGSSTAQPLEMEALQTNRPPVQSKPLHVHYLEQTWALIKLYMEYYPKITTVIVFCLIGIIMSMIIPNLRKPVTRNRLNHDYSHISKHYDFKASQMDHWCLWGGDDKCPCLDFTEPESRSNVNGWLDVHEKNKERVKDAAGLKIDVTFLGDGMVEMLNGNRLGKPTVDGPSISKLFKKFFTKEGGGEFEGLALGIEGDSSANLLWRLQHGELPNSNVYWLWNGITDLTKGYCSEEATVLGILKTAEELAYHDPEAVVVVQGILPMSKHGGVLDGTGGTGAKFRKLAKVAHSVTQAKKRYLFWPSIKAINKELMEFCEIHDQIVYFDASDFFLGTIGNKHYHQKSQQIVQALMPDYIHPSFEGYKVLLKHIKGELEKILWDLDEENDVETKDDERSLDLKSKD